MSDEERVVTDHQIKLSTEASSQVGFPVTGFLKREGDTFENKDLGDAWNEAFDGIEHLKEKIEEIDNE